MFGKIFDKGCEVRHVTDNFFGLHWKLITAIAFVSLEDVNDGYKFIESSKDDKDFDRSVNCLEEICIRKVLRGECTTLHSKIVIRSCFYGVNSQQYTTNNATEAFNIIISSHGVKCKHPRPFSSEKKYQRKKLPWLR